MTFETLGLSQPLLRAVHKSGYHTPTPIQAQAIPAILKGSDVMAAAQTGTGKTAGFTLPLLQRLCGAPPPKAKKIRALVLAPTRELAAQIQSSIATYGKFLQLQSTVVYGGTGIGPQKKALRRGVDVLVATPGRLLDLYQQDAVHFDSVEIFVLDEADRMLDMGFIDDIKKIMSMLPKARQSLMFSATFSGPIRQLAKTITLDALEIDVAPRNVSAANIHQLIHPVDKARKDELLSHLIRTQNWHQALVFCRTKHGADRLTKRLLRDKISSATIHGNKTQAQRSKALSGFKHNKFQVLVATDIAARGIDINQLSQVVNFDLPYVAEDYIHRIGRTGRAGASGQAISLVSADEAKHLCNIERLIKHAIERKEIEGFEPEHLLPQIKRGTPARPHRQRKSGGKATPHIKKDKDKKPSRFSKKKRPTHRNIRHAKTSHTQTAHSG